MSDGLNKNISRCGSEYVLTTASKVKEEEEKTSSLIMCGGHDNVNITKKCIQSENEEPKNPPAYVCGGMKNTTLPANAPKVKVKI